MYHCRVCLIHFLCTKVKGGKLRQCISFLSLPFPKTLLLLNLFLNSYLGPFKQAGMASFLPTFTACLFLCSKLPRSYPGPLLNPFLRLFYQWDYELEEETLIFVVIIVTSYNFTVASLDCFPSQNVFFTLALCTNPHQARTVPKWRPFPALAQYWGVTPVTV